MCAVCWAMFFLQVFEVFKQFAEETSTTGIQYSTETSLELPHITVCPRVPYKQPALPQDEQTYVENTLALSEIFHDPPDLSMWNVTQLRSFFNGLCFVLHPLIKTNQYYNDAYLFLNISSNISVDLFLHPEGMELFLAFSVPRPEITILRLQFEMDTRLALIKLSKTKGSILKRREGNCREYSSLNEFPSCIANVTRNYYQTNVGCVMPNMRDAFHNASAKPKCVPNSKEHEAAFEALYDINVYKLTAKDCPDSCSKVQYQASATLFSGHTFPSYRRMMENSFVQIGVYYETFIVEKSVESVLYNFTQMLSAVGGSLGLFLGFSCYSLTCDIVDAIRSFRSKRKHLRSKAVQTNTGCVTTK